MGPVNLNLRPSCCDEGGNNGRDCRKSGKPFYRAAIIDPMRIKAVIPLNPTRKYPLRYYKSAYKGCNVIERMCCRLQDFRPRCSPLTIRAPTSID
jgi:hypothetical protein